MNNKEINFEYTTKPIGKVVEKENHPTGINFTIKLDLENRSEEELAQFFWDIQILLRTIQDEIEGRREKDSAIIGIDLASGEDKVGYFDEQ